MLGIHRKKKSLPNPFAVELGKKIVYNMTDDNENDFRRSKHRLMPLLPMGMYNNSIPYEWYIQLDNHWRANYRRLDLQKIFLNDPELEEPEEVEIPDNEFVKIGIRANIPLNVVSESKKRKELFSTIQKNENYANDELEEV